MQRFEEYQYRTIMHATKEEFLCATKGEVEWMTRIHAVINRAQEKVNKR